METFLSPVGLHGFGNIQSLGSVKQQGKMSGWRGYCVSGGGERVVCVCVCVCVCGGGGGGEEKDIIGLIGMWKCVYIKDLLTLV